jgi:hypothetical protein
MNVDWLILTGADKGWEDDLISFSKSWFEREKTDTLGLVPLAKKKIQNYQTLGARSQVSRKKNCWYEILPEKRATTKYLPAFVHFAVWARKKSLNVRAVGHVLPTCATQEVKDTSLLAKALSHPE